MAPVFQMNILLAREPQSVCANEDVQSGAVKTGDHGTFFVRVPFVAGSIEASGSGGSENQIGQIVIKKQGWTVVTTACWVLRRTRRRSAPQYAR